MEDLGSSVFGNLGGMVALGGPVVAILLALSVVLVALVIVKLWQFRSLRLGRHTAARKALSAWLQSGDRKPVDALSGDPNPAARILFHAVNGTEKLRQGDAKSPTGETVSIREDLERVGGAMVADMRRYLRVFETSVQVAPLLGLFGTVVGMIEAFRRLQEAGARVDASDLAGGIWVALLTTAAGLLVAMPSSLVLNWFESRIAREQRAMEDMAVSVLTGRVTEPGDAQADTTRIAA